MSSSKKTADEGINIVADSSTDVQEVKVSPYDADSKNTSRWENFRDGFRKQEVEEGQSKHLSKQLSQRHIIMIALSTGVGTGLWVGTGKLLAKSGPGFLLVGYVLVCSMIFFVIDAAGELAVAYGNLNGGFNAYPRKFIDESFGFAVGWNYCIQWLTVVPLELVTAAITIKYWTNVNSDIFVAPFYVLILGINFFGAKGYGEAEFFFNFTKMLTIAGFIILAIIIDCGGAGEKKYIGAVNWHDPAPFKNGFKGLCNVFVTAAFAFGGTEFVALTAAEQSNPKRSIPQAIKVVCYRIVFIFLLSLTMICFLVNSDSDELMGSGGSSTHASPFVIAVSAHGVRVVPHIINAVILLSVLSVANSAVYSSSRTIHSLAEQGFAPKLFTYIDKRGRPLMGLILAAVTGLFSFIAAYNKEETVFSWLLSITGLAVIFTFTSICISHIRFRAAMKAQGRSLNELGYRANLGTYGSIYAVILNILILMAQFWVALFPFGAKKPDANNFFQNYLGAVVLIVFYVGHKLWTRNFKFFYNASEIDLVSDRRIFDIDLIKQEEEEHKMYVKNASFLVKMQNFFC